MSYDGPRFPSLTPAIKQLLILNAAVFVLNMVLLGRLSTSDDGGGFWFAFSWGLSLEGYGLGVLRLLTYQFTHSFGDAMHFLGNMLVLFFMGTIAEDRLGYRGTIKLYLVGGVAGALFHVVLASLNGHADIPLIGASGACYAFLVYAACRLPNVLVFNVLPLWIVAAALVFIGAYSTFLDLAAGYRSGVAHGAHLGGAAVGFVAFRRDLFIDWGGHAGVERPGLFASLSRAVRERQANAKLRAHQQREARVDQLLAKVKESGISSLTSQERRFLEQVSKKN